jgi:hypothetical protein
MLAADALDPPADDEVRLVRVHGRFNGGCHLAEQ